MEQQLPYCLQRPAITPTKIQKPQVLLTPQARLTINLQQQTRHLKKRTSMLRSQVVIWLAVILQLVRMVAAVGGSLEKMCLETSIQKQGRAPRNFPVFSSLSIM